MNYKFFILIQCTLFFVAIDGKSKKNSKTSTETETRHRIHYVGDAKVKNLSFFYVGYKLLIAKIHTTVGSFVSEITYLIVETIEQLVLACFNLYIYKICGKTELTD